MQAMEATTAPTKVIYGVNELDLDLAGKTVRGIWQALSQVLNIPRDVPALVSRESLALTLALLVYTAAINAETLRAGILALDRGQMEAARSLGLSHAAALRYVVLPQAFRNTLPPLLAQFTTLVKDTSLASLISFQELMLMTQSIIDRTHRIFELYIGAAAVYFVICYPLSQLVRTVEGLLWHRVEVSAQLDPDCRQTLAVELGHQIAHQLAVCRRVGSGQRECRGEQELVGFDPRQDVRHFHHVQTPHDAVQAGVAGEHRGTGQTRRAQELANRETLRGGLWQIPHLLRPIVGNTNHRQTVADVTTFQPEEVGVDACSATVRTVAALRDRRCVPVCAR